jgi:hypothetical protein
MVRWTCSRCGEVHVGLPFDLAFDAPIYWTWLSPEERDEQGRLNEDLCEIRDGEQTDRFVRGVLELPVRGSNEAFCYGVWTSLGEASFSQVLALWDDPRQDGREYFGWLSNRLRGYPDTLNLKTTVQTRAHGLRPTIILAASDHPLALEQREGITMERVREIVELNMHSAA